MVKVSGRYDIEEEGTLLGWMIGVKLLCPQPGQQQTMTDDPSTHPL